jgi:hypothetical protein
MRPEVLTVMLMIHNDSGTLCCINQERIPSVSKVYNALIFRINQSKKSTLQLLATEDRGI